MQNKPTYIEAIQTEKKDLGLDTFELPSIWNLVDIYPRYEPKYKRRWKIEINGSSYWIYAMHDSQVEHYTKMYGEGEAPKTGEYQIEPSKLDSFKEAFEVQTPVTPEEVGVVEFTPDGSYEAGLQLEQAVKFYQCIEEQKATLQPHLVDLTSNQLIVESLVDNPILTVAEFRANFPNYFIEVYHDYLRKKISAMARANKPFLVEDNDTLAEIQIAIQSQSAFSAERIKNEGLGLDQFIQGIQSEAMLLDPNDANPMGEVPSEVVRTLRKKILMELDKWWGECLTRFDLNVIYGDRRSEFIRKEYLRHRKYLKHMLLDVIEPHDTSDNIAVDTTQWNVFNLLGKNDEGEWIRPVALTFNHARGHFELFENLED